MSKNEDRTELVEIELENMNGKIFDSAQVIELDEDRPPKFTGSKWSPKARKAAAAFACALIISIALIIVLTITIPIVLLVTTQVDWNCIGESCNPQNNNTNHDQAIAYLNNVLDTMQDYFVHRNSIDWQTLRQTALNQTIDAQNTSDTYAAIHSTINQLNYPHTKFFEPNQVQAFQSQIQNMTGIDIDYTSKIVYLVREDSVAQAKGVKIGDKLIAIDELNVNDLDEIQFLREVFEFQGRSKKFQFSRGSSNFAVDLYTQPTVKQLFPTGKIITSGYLKIGYIELPTVASVTKGHAEYETQGHQLIRDMDQRFACGYVIDVRRNSGGPHWPMLSAIAPLLGNGTSMYFIDHFDNNTLFEVVEQINGSIYDGSNLVSTEVFPSQYLPLNSGIWPPVAILTTSITSAGAEALVVAFRNRYRSHSFGGATDGKASANILYEYDDGSVLSLTVAIDADRTGKPYEFQITPDTSVPYSQNWASFGDPLKDKVLQRAVEWTYNQCNMG